MKPTELRLRQQRLLIRSTELRLQLREDLQRLQRPAAWVDLIKARMLWLYQHPQWPIGVLALVLFLKPKKALLWSGRLWWLWKSAPLIRRWRDTLIAFLPQR